MWILFEKFIIFCLWLVLFQHGNSIYHFILPNDFCIMEKKYFFLKLNPRRADFAQTMTANERQIMFKHIEYWKGLMSKSKVIVFGPVLDPKAVYGVGVISVESENEVKELISNDPAAKINDYEYYEMKAVLPG